MKLLGIIGGLGPESTLEYYRLLFEAYRSRVHDGSAPLIVVNSIEMKKLVDWVSAEAYAEMVDYLVAEIERLARAGADFAIISANTPHIVFDQIRERSPIPLISIIEATARAAKRQKLARPALFGTRFTMRGSFYPKVFEREGISLVVPDSTEQNYIHDKYMNELVRVILLPETREGLLSLVSRMQQRDGIQGLILGGTELPLILREPSHAGIPLLNTTKIHVRAMVAQLGW